VDTFTIFITTFSLIFIGELGDKTQFAAGTGTLSNRNSVWIIFISSALALIAVASVTVLGAGLVPSDYLPVITRIGGIGLILYGVWLFYHQQDMEVDKDLHKTSCLVLFASHFSVVFMAELGDKTQMITLASALENQAHLVTVCAASASALVIVTALTVWGVTKIPTQWVHGVRLFGIIGMISYGLYMLFSRS
jgi:putative Ca2+/H+ antiporter (TMEM165/GDT1 family)